MEMVETNTKGRESRLLDVKYDHEVEFFFKNLQKQNKTKNPQKTE